MSKFKTSIPVDVDAIKKLLPEGAYVHGVEWDEEQKDVNVLWEHDAFKTPVDFPVEFPRVNLEEQKLPEGVTLRKPEGAEVPPANKPLPEGTPPAAAGTDGTNRTDEPPASAEPAGVDTSAAPEGPMQCEGPVAEPEAAPAAVPAVETAVGTSEVKPVAKGNRRR